MKKVVLVEEVVSADGVEDKEEARVIMKRMSIEMKRDLKTSPR